MHFPLLFINFEPFPQILSLNPTFKRVKVEAVRKIIRKLQNPEKSWKNVEKDKLAEKIQHNEAMLNFIKVSFVLDLFQNRIYMKQITALF